MVRIAWVLVIAVAAVVPLRAQKKPDPKPETAPASQPAAAVDPELQKELDAIGADLSVRLNVLPGKTFDLVGTINPAQLQLLMEVADRAFKIFEDMAAGAGGVASESATGGAKPAPGETPAITMFGGRKCMIMILNNTQQYNAFGQWYEKHYKWDGTAAAMKPVNYFPLAWPRCAIVSHLRPLDMNMMRNVVAHEIGHMCAYRYAYNNAESPIWFVEGLATCIEGKTTGTTSCYCFSGGYGDATAQNKNLVNREWSKWKAQVKALVKAKQDKAIEHILPMRLNELGMNETGKAMSIVDMWMQEPAKMIQWLRLTKKYWPPQRQGGWEPGQGTAQKRALKEVFNQEWPELDEAWRKFAQARY